MVSPFTMRNITFYVMKENNSKLILETGSVGHLRFHVP